MALTLSPHYDGQEMEVKVARLLRAEGMWGWGWGVRRVRETRHVICFKAIIQSKNILISYF